MLVHDGNRIDVLCKLGNKRLAIQKKKIWHKFDFARKFETGTSIGSVSPVQTRRIAVKTVGKNASNLIETDTLPSIHTNKS